jgi:hypothetical protein
MKYVAVFIGGVVFWQLFGDVILRSISKAFHKVGDFLGSR